MALSALADLIRHPGFVPTKVGNHLKDWIPAGVYPVAERGRNDVPLRIEPFMNRHYLINSLKIEWTSSTKSPLAPLFQRGVIPPFGKGRCGGILQINVFIIMRPLITLQTNRRNRLGGDAEKGLVRNLLKVKHHAPSTLLDFTLGEVLRNPSDPNKPRITRLWKCSR
jgi:hypothetical protein